MYERNSREVSNQRNFANIFEFKNSHQTCESHLMQGLSHNSHRHKTLTYVFISICEIIINNTINTISFHILPPVNFL
jgi:hypothetical protein